MQDTSQDNIAETNPIDTVTTGDPAGATADPEAAIDMDQYLARFDNVSSNNEQLAKVLSAIDKAPYDQERIQTIIKYMHCLQKQNESLFDLLVEMNNIMIGIHDKIM